jgi:hypothetical protein
MFDHSLPAAHLDAGLSSVHGLTGGFTKATPIVPTDPSAAGGSFVSFDGATISGTITGITAHTWVDNAEGLFNTSTNLSAEWTSYYQTMIEGQGASLTPTDRLEAQAEALFTITGLNTSLSSTALNADMQDVQREIDVIGAAQQIAQTTLGINPNTPLTAQTYYDLVQIIQANPQLEELGVQGHGLNDPPLPRYDGYTNDLQNNSAIDRSMLYVGPGADRGESAIQDFMDDAIMSHIIFPVVMRNGKLIQLNQDGDKEQTLTSAVNTVDRMMYGNLLTKKDFAK